MENNCIYKVNDTFDTFDNEVNHLDKINDDKINDDMDENTRKKMKRQERVEIIKRKRQRISYKLNISNTKMLNTTFDEDDNTLTQIIIPFTKCTYPNFHDSKRDKNNQSSEELRQLTRKQRNRESAERSRRRKEELIDELTFQLLERYVIWTDLNHQQQQYQSYPILSNTTECYDNVDKYIPNSLVSSINYMNCKNMDIQDEFMDSSIHGDNNDHRNCFSILLLSPLSSSDSDSTISNITAYTDNDSISEEECNEFLFDY